jgi:hypothetical protein
MSVTQKLPDVHPFFMQECPFCQRSNRMVVKGVYVKDGKHEVHPDMGYSFCNCRSVFYTRPENIIAPFSYAPVNHIITAPDIFFVEWDNDPYRFPHWDVRRYQILWEMEAYVESLKLDGYEVKRAWREFEVGATYPMHFHVEVA